MEINIKTSLCVDRAFDLWMMEQIVVETQVCANGFLVDAACDCAICLSGCLNVAISFLIHGEWDASVKPVEVFQDEFELVLTVLLNGGVVSVTQPY